MARSIQKGNRRFAGIPSRLQMQAQNNLGTIMSDRMGLDKQFRDPNLDVYDAYYENRQYDDLAEWDSAAKQGEAEYIPVRQRRPRIIYNVAKVLVDKVASKLIGTATFPKFVVEEDPDDTEFFRTVIKAASLRRNLVDPIKHMLLSGASFVRYFLVDGVIEVEWAHSKYCYPKFDAKGELEEIEIRYVYEDTEDKNPQGKFTQKWYKLLLTKTADVLFDNPEYRPGAGLPEFKEVERNDHGLGWVQGEWLRNAKHKFDPDGNSLIGDILDFIDDLNYSLSQSSGAIGYNQDPQLGINGVDEDEIERLIKSSEKAWNLGREGKAEFIESNMAGVTAAEENRDHNRARMLDVVRVVLHDPEKMVASAQSGKALEVLNAPLVELVDEIRTMIEGSLINLIIKMGMTMLAVMERGELTSIQIPPGYVPNSLDLVAQWPEIYPLTLQDIQLKVAAAVQATTGKLLSRESATRWLASCFGIENIDEELSKIAAEPDLNPFGTFGGP